MDVVAKTLTFDIKTHDFKTTQKATTMPTYVGSAQELYKCFVGMLDTLWPVEPTRMIRLNLSQLRKRTKADGVNQSMDFFLKKDVVDDRTTEEAEDETVIFEEDVPIKDIEKAISVCPKSMTSKLNQERKKQKDEMFKKVIGQKDINCFFKPANEPSESEQDAEQEDSEINEEPVAE